MKHLFSVAVFVLLSVSLSVVAQEQNWIYGGEAGQSKYFDYSQITPANVSELEIAFTVPVTEETAYQFTPVIINGVMYLQARDSSLVAVDAATGEEVWVQSGYRGMARRGIAYWHSEDGHEERLLITYNNQLSALDVSTGEIITSFGDDGIVDLREGVGRPVESIRRVQGNGPGVVYENLIILGSSPGEGYFSPPGHVRAYSVLTGEMEWIFHTIPQPGEYGYDTWPEDAYLYAGGVNVWGEISVDSENGIAYLPLGSPTYDYYGADRPGANLFGSSIVAVDATTGERIWHFQTVHHDLWDYDLTAAPQLMSVVHDGKEIPAVAQATKQGFLFVFNRLTGEPVFDIEEREVPPSTIPGEQAWPTQPFPTELPVTARHSLTADTLTTLFLTEEERAAWITRIESAGSGLYTPISTEETIGLPGGVGGTNWGNTAANPEQGILYVMNQDFPSFYRLEPEIITPPSQNAQGNIQSFSRQQRGDGRNAYQLYCQVCHGGDRSGGSNGPSLLGIEDNISYDELHRIVTQGQNRMPAQEHIDDTTITNLLAYLGGDNSPQFRVGADYPEGVDGPEVQYRTDYGLSHPHIMEPPWSTITAVDLNTGEQLWRIPLGQDKLASELGHEGTGVPRGTQRNGMIITSTGIVFSTAKDGHVYAFDADTGETLWAGELPMGTEGLPAMYVVDGRQYLVVNATTPLTWGPDSRESGIGSEEPMGQGGYVVFALPEQ